jgi:hypothetical protein
MFLKCRIKTHDYNAERQAWVVGIFGVSAFGFAECGRDGSFDW